MVWCFICWDTCSFWYADELSSVLNKESFKVVGWHVLDTQPYARNYVDEKASMMPSKMEWSGFVLNSRLLWKKAVGDDKPNGLKMLAWMMIMNNEEIDSPLSLVKDPSMAEPLGNCGRRVLLWWLRVEARVDSKFPPGWIIKSPREITVQSKWTPWPDSSSEFPKEAKRRSTKARGSKSKSSKGKQEFKYQSINNSVEM